jgi:cyclophilin family peptidyl-prolyl cis-trans isomerase
MTSRTTLALQSALVASLVCFAQAGVARAAFEDCGEPLDVSNPTNPIVELVTPLGSICVELLADAAPATVDYFLGYLERDEIAGTFFHFAQPGIFTSAGFRYAAGQLLPVLEEPAPPAEDEACIPDEPVDSEDPGGPQQCSERGSIAGSFGLEYLAQADGRPTWFINVADNRSFLDEFGLPVFGQIVGDGLAVAETISNLAQYPQEYVYNSVSSSPQFNTERLSQLPLQAMPPDTPGEFGCFDVDDIAALFCDFDPTGFDPDNPSGLFGVNDMNDPGNPTSRLFEVSGQCGTTLADFDDFIPTPSEEPDCGDVDRFSIGILDLLTPPTRQLFKGVDGQRSLSAELFYSFSPADVTESEAQVANRRATMSQRIAANAVPITSAVNLPEPERGLLAAVAVGAITWLRGRRRQRTRRPPQSP